MTTKRECAGLYGENCVCHRKMVVWAFVISIVSILQCLPNRRGDLLIILSHYVHASYMLSITRIVMFLRASLKKKVSYTWHSVMARVNTLKHGHI